MSFSRILIISAALFCLSAIGCSSNSSKMCTAYLKDGNISISKKIPPVSELNLKSKDLNLSDAAIFAFMPFSNPLKKSLVVDTAKKTMQIISFGGEVINTFKITNNNSKKLKKLNKTTVSFVEENPIWYANNSYFKNRKLEIPANGAKERYLKNILGKSAIHLENESFIYEKSTDAINEDIQGIFVSKNAMKILKKSLSAGSSVVIK